MEFKKKVSIVLPVYNGELNVANAISSIINQTYYNWELIIVNDCSTDGTAEIIQKFAERDSRIKIINNTVNLKLPAALNVGFRNATGEYYTWTSDDNLYKENAIERMVMVLQSAPEYDMVYAEYTNIDEKDTEISEAHLNNPEGLLRGNTIGACFLYTSRIAKKIGEYDVDLFLAEDYDYWLRIWHVGKIMHIEDNLYYYRRHAGSLSETKKAYIGVQTFKVLEKNFSFMYSVAKTRKERYDLFDQIVFLAGKDQREEVMNRLCNIDKMYMKHRLIKVIKDKIYLKIFVIKNKVKNKMDNNNFNMKYIKKLILNIVKKNYIYKIYNKSKKYEIEYKKVRYLLEHIDIENIKPANGYLRKRQKMIMEFAGDVFTELQKIDIHPFLAGGNLIGWIRHGGFVPWDDDLDFGIFREDYDRLIKYAKENWIVLEYEGENKNQQSWIDSMTRKYAGKYVLFVYYAHVQIAKGNSCMDRQSIDFFTYDFYNENASFEKHNAFVRSIDEKLIKCKDEKSKLKLVRNAIIKADTVTTRSKNIYFGMDSCEPYLRTFNTSWINYEILFPLKEIEYEGTKVFIPNKPTEFIMFEYPNFREFPEDFGQETHGYWKEYKSKHLVTMEFYLIDAFEIKHFEPIYYYMRGKGIYAIFIAEPVAINSSGEWFDYDNAIRILEERELEFDTVANPNADYAFTTQRIGLLYKYKNKKINVGYGCGLVRNQFGHMIESIKGFDYKFVHGDFTKELCKRNLNESDWRKYGNKIHLMGYPRFNTRNFRLNGEKYDSEIIKRAHGKIIVGFLPTWGENSCIKEFQKEIQKLKERYFVVTKPHHCTVRLKSERMNLDIIKQISDMVVSAEYDTENMVSECDIVICNAESGVSLEIPWLKKNVKLILITKKRDMGASFFPEISKVGTVINNPSDLLMVVEEQLKHDNLYDSRSKFINQVFGDNDKNYLHDIYKNIFEKDVRDKW